MSNKTNVSSKNKTEELPCKRCAMFEGKREYPYGGYCDDPNGGRYFVVPSIHEILQRPIVGRKNSSKFELYINKQ